MVQPKVVIEVLASVLGYLCVPSCVLATFVSKLMTAVAGFRLNVFSGKTMQSDFPEYS